MKTSHTPGPWVACPEVGGEEQIGKVGTGPDGWLGVAQVFGDTPDEVSANTALIAAAPDLLAALEACLDYPDHNIGCETEREARAAIAKATGEKT